MLISIILLLSVGGQERLETRILILSNIFQEKWTSVYEHYKSTQAF